MLPTMTTRSTAILITSISLLFAGCAGNQTQLKNPLTAARYGEELADTMANLVIANDPIAKTPEMQTRIHQIITEGKQITMDARTKTDRGMKGGLIPIKENTTGYALYLDDILYFSSEFETKPGPDLHVFLTTAVDPRDVTFPDKTAVDLGILQSPYGAQQYSVPPEKNPALLRTVVLYDLTVKRLYAFGQLSK